MVLFEGLTSDGKAKPINVDDEGNFIQANQQNGNLREGTNITGVSMPTGGAGLFGWLSAIWKLINDRIPILGQRLASASTPVTLSTDGIFATFAGLASDESSITGSIHAKLRAIATSLSLASTASRTNATASTSLVTLLVANSSRKKAIFKNTSTTLTWYLVYGIAPGGSTSDYTIDLLPGDVYAETGYTGWISGVCSGSTAATLLITELSVGIDIEQSQNTWDTIAWDNLDWENS